MQIDRANLCLPVRPPSTYRPRHFLRTRHYSFSFIEIWNRVSAWGPGGCSLLRRTWRVPETQVHYGADVSIEVALRNNRSRPWAGTMKLGRHRMTLALVMLMIWISLATTVAGKDLIVQLAAILAAPRPVVA